jgi:hypothetical protein
MASCCKFLPAPCTKNIHRFAQANHSTQTKDDREKDGGHIEVVVGKRAHGAVQGLVAQVPTGGVARVEGHIRRHTSRIPSPAGIDMNVVPLARGGRGVNVVGSNGGTLSARHLARLGLNSQYTMQIAPVGLGARARLAMVVGITGATTAVDLAVACVVFLAATRGSIAAGSIHLLVHGLGTADGGVAFLALAIDAVAATGGIDVAGVGTPRGCPWCHVLNVLFPRDTQEDGQKESREKDRQEEGKHQITEALGCGPWTVRFDWLGFLKDNGIQGNRGRLVGAWDNRGRGHHGGPLRRVGLGVGIHRCFVRRGWVAIHHKPNRVLFRSRRVHVSFLGE